MPKTVKPDARGRITLGDIVKPNAYYLVSSDETGTIYLEPAVVVTMRELEEGLAQSARGETVNLGSFAQYADMDIEDEAEVL